MKQEEMFEATLQLKPGHRERMTEILRHYAKTGMPLAHVAKDHMLNRSLSTLKRYCSLGQIAFVDWVPLRMRPKPTKPIKSIKPRRKRPGGKPHVDLSGQTGRDRRLDVGALLGRADRF